MLAGFAFAFTGDWFLAVKGAGRGSSGFLAGVAAFSLAQAFWTVAQLREARPDARIVFAFGVPLVAFSAVRLAVALPPMTWAAVCLYSAVTAVSFATALATRRMFYAWGIGLLLFSDMMIAGRMLGAPGCGALVGPVYMAAEVCLIVSLLAAGERRFGGTGGDAWPAAAMFGLSAFVCFALSALTYPGGGYDPCMKMLSALGRTVVREVGYPLCHYLFMCGMFLSAAGVWRTLAHRDVGGVKWRRVALSAGAAMNVAGLCTIALIPENVCMGAHNIGCWMAALGGAAALFAIDGGGRDRIWTCVLTSIAIAFGVILALQAAGAVPFAPWVTSMQKVLIAGFALWIGELAWRGRKAGLGPWRKSAVAALLALLALAALLQTGTEPPRAEAEVACAPEPVQTPFSDDERAALRWLDHVTGDLPQDEEREWWDFERGGGQFGLFAKRYNIAFCGYAAAALGMRGGEAERMQAGRILGNCIGRYLRRDVWAYSMSRNYWGRKPWAPDPCFRDNVMYTGHLLQLLALYETFTGDTRYWKEGFDFVWKDGRRVHYTVKRLIDVTVRQMRKGPNGGVMCEPGLMFFPCNNHPHVAMSLFSRLGHGDWSGDARRWERWALSHYFRPLFGGGALNLVYHVRSGIMYPRGCDGLDGWSLLWYEPWATDRAAATAIWRAAAGKIDWDGLSRDADRLKGGVSCCTPVDVPPVATAAFLAAAARACDDDATAGRLERISDRFLVRRDGMLYLDVGRAWRIGSTANRIIALAEANGFRFRRMLKKSAGNPKRRMAEDML